MVNESPPFNKEKFKQVVHYIVSIVGSLDNVGKTILYKILYFSDFDYYEINGKSITGESYFKLKHGPAPSSFDLCVAELKEEEKIKEIKANYGLPQIKFISLQNPKLDLLNAEEIKIIDKIIKRLSGMTARQVSGYSHEDIPWKATEENKEIDYDLVFYRDSTYSVAEDSIKSC